PRSMLTITGRLPSTATAGTLPTPQTTRHPANTATNARHHPRSPRRPCPLAPITQAILSRRSELPPAGCRRALANPLPDPRPLIEPPPQSHPHPPTSPPPPSISTDQTSRARSSPVLLPLVSWFSFVLLPARPDPPWFLLLA